MNQSNCIGGTSNQQPANSTRRIIPFSNLIPSRELTYPTLGSSENHRLKMPFFGDMLVPWRVTVVDWALWDPFQMAMIMAYKRFFDPNYSPLNPGCFNRDTYKSLNIIPTSLGCIIPYKTQPTRVFSLLMCPKTVIDEYFSKVFRSCRTEWNKYSTTVGILIQQKCSVLPNISKNFTPANPWEKRVGEFNHQVAWIQIQAIQACPNSHGQGTWIPPEKNRLNWPHLLMIQELPTNSSLVFKGIIGI